MPKQVIVKNSLPNAELQRREKMVFTLLKDSSCVHCLCALTVIQRTHRSVLLKFAEHAGSL